MTKIGIASLTLLTVCIVGCGSPDNSSSAPNPPALKVSAAPLPKPLEDIGHEAETAYDMAKISDWPRANTAVANLKTAMKDLTSANLQLSNELSSLADTIPVLEKAVAGKNRATTMKAGNAITIHVAELSRSFNPPVPVEVVLLDAYGRDLEIYGEAKDMPMLTATAKKIRQTWDKVRGSVEAKNKATSDKFSALVTQVEAAKDPAAYLAVATPLLNEVDNLEKAFM